MWASSDSGMKVPDIGDVLASFALPAMAESVKAEEASREAKAAFDRLVAIGNRTGAKVEIRES